MMRSLYSGVSGLRVHQTKMDVIGNNIANVNTVGYKSSRVTFTEVFQQTTQSATGANAETGRGGTNAMQIGLGTSVGSISSDPTVEGSTQRTDNPADLKVSGANFFVVNDGSMNYFTKVGAFTIDSAGYLVTQSGYHVMGWQVDPATMDVKRDLVSPLAVETPENLYAEPSATTDNYFTGNIDKTNSEVTGEGLTTSMTIYDKQGYAYTVKYNLVQSEDDDSSYNFSLVDILDTQNNSILAANGGGYDATINGGDTVELKFNADTGAFQYVGSEGNSTFSLDITGINNNFYNEGADGESIQIDMSTTTMYAASGKCSITSVRGDLDGLGAGKAAGTMSGVNIGQDGKIVATYDNGDTKLLGQIVVASFANASGLEKVGESLYQTTPNSGNFDGIGKDPTAGGGSITQGALEMSNVDLSSEFTEMITTQRGFQANSRIITTSDTLLEELVNLKR